MHEAESSSRSVDPTCLGRPKDGWVNGRVAAAWFSIDRANRWAGPGKGASAVISFVHWPRGGILALAECNLASEGARPSAKTNNG